MKVTIITVVYNGVKTIQKCIESVLAQDYPHIEYIVVDGASKDTTLELVQSYGDRVAKIISEPDNGIYDAMNKGVNLATGDIVGILNADDWYASPTVISKVVQRFIETKCDATYGDLVYVDGIDTTKVLRRWISGEYQVGSFLNGWMPPHPTFFVKRELYNRLGDFRLDMGSAADYELMLRYIHKHQITLAYVPEIIVNMRAGGVSNSSIGNRVKANQMDRKAWEVNELTPRFYTLFMKPLRKIAQFLSK